jgi:hypothetical protein
MSFPEVMKELGTRWARLSEADRAPYNEKHFLDKSRYYEE